MSIFGSFRKTMTTFDRMDIVRITLESERRRGPATSYLQELVMTGPYRQDREPCVECARRAAEPKAQRAPLTKAQRGALATCSLAIAMFAMPCTTYYAFDHRATAIGVGLLTLLIAAFISFPFWWGPISSWIDDGATR